MFVFLFQISAVGCGCDAAARPKVQFALLQKSRATVSVPLSTTTSSQTHSSFALTDPEPWHAPRAACTNPQGRRVSTGRTRELSVARTKGSR